MVPRPPKHVRIEARDLLHTFYMVNDNKTFPLVAAVSRRNEHMKSLPSVEHTANSQ